MWHMGKGISEQRLTSRRGRADAFCLLPSEFCLLTPVSYLLPSATMRDEFLEASHRRRDFMSAPCLPANEDVWSPIWSW